MDKKQSIRTRIPNAITLLNLGNGFAALIATFEGEYRLGALLVLLGMLLDFADGFAARTLKAGSALGRELDSLNDLLCFAVVPALLLYLTLAGKVAGGKEGMAGNMGFGGTVLSVSWLRYTPVALVLAGAYRLARFNLNDGQGSFRGLPVPAAGFYVAGLILMLTGSGTEAEAWGRMASIAGSTAFVIGSILVLSMLMVSKVSLISMKMTHYRIRGNLHRYLLLSVSLILLLILKWTALPLIIIAYLLFSLVMYLMPKGKNQ